MKIRLFLVFGALVGGAWFAQAQTPAAPASTGPANESPAERNLRRSREAESRGLAEAFRGITTAGVTEPGLFPLRSTGVSTEPVRLAAVRWLGLLTPEQRAKSTFPVDDPEWRKWMNQHFYVRQGVSFKDMTGPQREAAFDLMRAAMSAKGLKLSQDIMKLNHTLGELNQDDFVNYGEWLYHVTVMGEPSATRPWGWQVDGHHLIINYFVLGDQVVMTPLFVGSEPVIAPSGKYKGLSILQQEQADGLALLRALDPGQRARAILTSAKTGNNNQTEAFRDNVVIPYAGVPAADLNPAQQQRLLALIALFVDNLKEGQAKVKMDEVRAHLARTHFAWIGGADDASVFYYRIHSPVVLIEFDHQRPANYRPAGTDTQMPNREHIHVVVRTPNGNDYGKDLLRQHLEQHKH
ncbi:MAG: DUF3500 domain-containing protein [Opitutaceae bacterium]|nr:DUF3500 domain-containing protein [Opitutaceae bacterium]